MNKSIIIYFSRADENYSVGVVQKGNTEVIAEYIKEYTNSDMFKVERLVPYAKDYQTCIEEAKEEKQNNIKPELKETLKDISMYDTIYIGTPIYWGTMPMPLISQLEKLDWTNKNIKVFVTHEGSGVANVLDAVKRICIGANINDDALVIYGHDAINSKDKVREWI